MGIRQMIVRNGNENRIMELHEGGCGVNQISGIFLDYGIKVAPMHIAGVIGSHEALCSKALPKSVVKAAIRAQKSGWDDAVPVAS